MSSAELRASASLASVFALRLFGMFVILPVFALWAEGRPGWDLTLAGIAMGAYGLTQAVLQLPFGWISDRRGRKPVIYVGLAMLSAGSFLAAASESPWLVIAGRMLQGAGAISATVMALAADLTRESQRTKAMAIIGGTIGGVFALSFAAGPFLTRLVGVPGLFAITGVLALVAIVVVRFAVPDEPPGLRDGAGRMAFRDLLREPELARLNVGIFALHAVLMALFIVVPVALAHAGLPAAEHGWVYLGTVAAGFVLALPAFLLHSRAERPTFLAAIFTVMVGIGVLMARLDSLATILAALVIFFAGFNVLEAKLPALVSRAAPREARGAATGVYSSVQFLGTFCGAAAGGAVAQHAGFMAVLAGCAAVVLAWLAVAWNMGDFVPAASPDLRT